MDDLAQAQEAVRHIGEMMRTEGWRYYAAEVEQRLTAERNRMDVASFATLEEAKLHAGIIQGLKFALGVHARVEERAEALREEKK